MTSKFICRSKFVPALFLAAATLASSSAFSQEFEEIPEIRISGVPSESLQTDDVEAHPRTARLQPRGGEPLPLADEEIGDFVIESLNPPDGETIFEDEGSGRRRRRQRRSSVIFGTDYGSPVYQGPILGSPLTSRLVRTPPMFGDSGGSIATLEVDMFEAGIPLAGGNRLVKISENNQALPLDRAFLSYHHYQNAFQINDSNGPRAADSVDQWLLGVERTLGCSDWSVELRMPFSQRVDMAANGLTVAGGHWGDLLVSLKRLMHRGESFAVASGLGVTVPIGSGARSRFNNINLQIDNDALHFLPFVGITSDTPRGFFYHGFVQLDIPFNGNDAVATAGGNAQRETFDEINLWHVDVSAGYWLYQADDCCQCGWCISGIAPVVELHYTSSFLDDSTVTFDELGQNVTPVLRADVFSVLNVTFGVHVEFGPGVLRAGAAFPLGAATSELFDAEFQATFMMRM